MRMRILVDAVALLLPGAGVRTYMHHWTTAVAHAAAANGHEVALFPHLHAAGALVHDRRPSPPLRRCGALVCYAQRTGPARGCLWARPAASMCSTLRILTYCGRLRRRGSPQPFTT